MIDALFLVVMLLVASIICSIVAIKKSIHTHKHIGAFLAILLVCDLLPFATAMVSGYRLLGYISAGVLFFHLVVIITLCGYRVTGLLALNLFATALFGVHLFLLMNLP